MNAPQAAKLYLMDSPELAMLTLATELATPIAKREDDLSPAEFLLLCDELAAYFSGLASCVRSEIAGEEMDRSELVEYISQHNISLAPWTINDPVRIGILRSCVKDHKASLRFED